MYLWFFFLGTYLGIGFAIGVCEYRFRNRVIEEDKYNWVVIPFNTLLWLPISLIILFLVLIDLIRKANGKYW